MKGYITKIFWFSVILTLSNISIVNATKPSPSYNVSISLENISQENDIAILKLNFASGATLGGNRNIGCFLPEGLELINDAGYSVEYKEFYPNKWGNEVIFYRGPIKEGDSKEITFKIRMPDEKKYEIHCWGGGGGSYDTLEIDLGDPEPPPAPEQEKRPSAGVRPMSIGEEDRELRTELKRRTKYKPVLKYGRDGQPGTPYRFLVYTPVEAQNAEAALYLPEGLELLNKEEFRIGGKDQLNNTVVTLYSGPMRFKESKAFYFRLKPSHQGKFKFEAKFTVRTQDGQTLIKYNHDTIDTNRRILY